MQNLHDIANLQSIRVDEHIYLRPLENGDAPAMLAILDMDPSIRESVTAAARMRDESSFYDEVKFINQSPDLIRYAIVHDDILVGLLSFWKDGGYFNADPIPNGYGFGYFLAPSARGKGIVTTSLLAVMDVAERCLTVDSFMAYCEDGNNRSKQLLQNIGLQPTDDTYAEPSQGWIERRYVKKVDL